MAPACLDPRRVGSKSRCGRRADCGTRRVDIPGAVMAKADADLDLLFGILAYQVDFLSHDALVGAVTAWLLDQDRPLSRILRERGALTDAHQALLESLVAAHVARHGGDPRCGLAAALAPKAVADIFREVANADIHAAMSHVPAGDTTLPDPSATRTSEGNGSAMVGARFFLLRPLARGAIGQVTVALDRELNREVALKEIQPRLADDPASRARFLLEAEVTGRLEHPGVIPIYSMGHDDFGRPYYAMRLIRGGDFKVGIDDFHQAEGTGRDPGARELQLRRLLRRFISACDTVAYAHSRGVLHRDLKPRNIMLGPYGETLVVDWGLAKIVGRDDARSSDDAERTLQPASAAGSSVTQPGAAAGTPAYMSPEQADGRLDLLGPASDVYSLGATLFHLLTGHAPFEGPGVTDILGKVRRGEFPTPRSVHRAVPAGLEAVCLKAMSLRPGDRYASASDLARDIERWLAEEPVSAWREPPTLRASRWLRRHRPWLTAGVAAVVVALVGLAATVTVQGQANRELRAANTREQRARRQAQDQFALALEAIQTFHTGASEDVLLKEPQFGALRAKLLRSALDFYRKLQATIDPDAGPAARADLASANAAVGIITAATGSKDDALTAFERARALYAELVRSVPRDARYRARLADVFEEIGDILSDTNHPAKAMWSYEQTREVRETLVRDHPGVARFEIALANTHRLIGIEQTVAVLPAEAMRSYQSALEILRPLHKKYPNLPPVQHALGAILNNIGNLQREAREFQLAMPWYGEALEIRKRLVETYPNRSGDRVALARIHHNIGLVLSEMGQPAAAIQSHGEGLKVQTDLLREWPTVTKYRFELARGLNHFGGVLRSHGPPDEALGKYGEALSRLRDLARDHPADPRIRMELARSLIGTAGLRRTAGDLTGALDSAREALTIAGRPPDDLPLLARAHSLCSVLVGRDPARLTPEEQAERRAHTADALTALRREEEIAGRRSFAALLEDADLGPLRTHAEFRAMRLRSRPPADPSGR